MTDMEVSPISDDELKLVATMVRVRLTAEFGHARMAEWLEHDREVGARFVHHTFLETRKLLHRKGMN